MCLLQDEKWLNQITELKRENRGLQKEIIRLKEITEALRTIFPSKYEWILKGLRKGTIKTGA